MQCIPSPYSIKMQSRNMAYPRPSFAKVMAAVDGSANSLKAFERAVSLAKALGAQLAIVHAISEPRTGSLVEHGTRYGSMAVVHAYVKGAEKHAVSWLKPLEEKAQLHGLETKTEILWEVGKSPAHLMTEYAKSNSEDLIIIGTRGLGGFKRLLLGSVASGVVRDAPCSVMVVR